jgi:putative membrane protein
MTDTGTDITETTEETWHRLSPAMLAVHPVQEIIRFLPVLVGVLFLGRNGSGQLWSLIALGVAVALGVIRWLTTTYQITPAQIRVRRGLLRRQVLSVPRDRIRSVDLTAHILQRILGLQRVVIGTGRSDRHQEGVTLDALSSAAAQRLRAELLHRTTEPVAIPVPTPIQETMPAVRPDETADGFQIAQLKPAWLRFGPFTLTGLATIGVLAGTLTQFVNDTHLDPNQVPWLPTVLRDLEATPLPVAILEVVVASVLAVAVLSSVSYLLAFWNFRLTRQPEGTLRVTRGLITIRSTTIEHRRLRGVELSEPLLLRAVNGARTIAITTGLRVGRGAERGGSLLLPPAPRAEAIRVGGEVYGQQEPLTCTLATHSRAARRRRHLRALLSAAVIVGAVFGAGRLSGWPAWTWQVALVSVPLAVLVADDRYRALGHALTGGTVVLRQGSLVRRRSVLDTNGIIGWAVHESFFQRRAGLATLMATTAAGKQFYTAVDIDAADAVAFADAATPGVLTPFLVRRSDS